MNNSFINQFQDFSNTAKQYSSLSLIWQRRLNWLLAALILLDVGLLFYSHSGWAVWCLIALSGLTSFCLPRNQTILLVGIAVTAVILSQPHHPQAAILVLSGALAGCLARWLVNAQRRLMLKASQAQANINLCEALLRTNRDCVKLIDNDRNLRLINQRGLQLMKAVNVCDVRLDKWFEQQAPQQREALNHAWQQALEHGYGEMSGALVHGDNQRGYWRVCMAGVADRQGQYSSVLIVTQDITEQVSSKMELEKLNVELVALLDGLGSMFIAFDQEQYIHFCNSRARQYLCSTVENANISPYKMPLHKLLPATVYQKVSHGLQQLNDAGNSFRDELQDPLSGRWIGIEIFSKPGGYNLFIKDIDEQYQQQQERKRALLTAELVQELESVGSWEYDLATTTLSLSRQALKVLDLDPIKQHDNLSVIHQLLRPRERIRLTQAFLQATQGQQSVSTYARIRRQSGEIVDVRFTLRCLFNTQEQAEKIIGSLQDISEQKARESYLKEAERLVRGIIDTVPSQICVIDSQGTLINVNQSWRNIAITTGSNPDSLCRGANYLQVCDQSADQGCKEAASIAEGIRTVISGQKDSFHSEYYLPVNERDQWFMLRVTPLKNNDNEPNNQLFVICHEDITEMKQLMLERESQREQLSLVLAATNDGIWDWQPEKNTTYYSARFLALLGHQHALPVFDQWLEQAVHPEQRESASVTLHEHFAQKSQLFDIDCQLRQGDGRYGWYRIRGKAEFQQERMVRFCGTLMDIGDYRQLLHELSEREFQFREMAEQIPDVFWDYDAQADRFRYVSPAFEKIWQYSLSEVQRVGLQWWKNTLVPADQDKILKLYSNALENGTSGFAEYRIHTRQGELRWINTRWFALKDAKGKAQRLVGTCRDISQFKLTQSKLKLASEQDALTGLLNRHSFIQKLKEQTDKNQSSLPAFALLFVDIDRLTTLNDSVGHDVGDKVLQQIGQRLSHYCPEHGILGRTGGDEFAMIFPMSAVTDNLKNMLNELVASFNLPYVVEQQSLFISASVGAAIYPEHGDSYLELMRNADNALQDVKAKGGGFYQVCQQPLSASQPVAGHLESELKQALDQNQFVLFYQVKVCAESGMPLGCEGLLRWQHPTKGLIPPATFMRRLENSGLIIPVGERILDMGLKQLKAWQDLGYKTLSMALNVSPRQLLYPGFVSSVTEALQRYQLEPQFLELELTESVLVSDPLKAVEVLTKIKALGVKLAIDDFGTGYSSLCYLRSFKPHTVKIDKSFIDDIEHDNEALKLLEGIINLCSQLGISTVAEGVELENQWNMLLQIGCPVLQGYLFARPLPAEAFFTQILQQPSLLEPHCSLQHRRS